MKDSHKSNDALGKSRNNLKSLFLTYWLSMFRRVAPSPSGKARVCKTLITSSNLVGASKILYLIKFHTKCPNIILIVFEKRSKRLNDYVCGSKLVYMRLATRRCGEMADAQDLKSWGRNSPCRFDPDHRHHY